MDALGTLLYTLMMALVCWRVAAGASGPRVPGDVGADGNPDLDPMLMLPGLALGAVLGSVQTSIICAPPAPAKAA
jgi:hypothetical protein